MTKQLSVKKVSLPLIQQKRVESDEAYLNRLDMFLKLHEANRGIDIYKNNKQEQNLGNKKCSY